MNFFNLIKQTNSNIFFFGEFHGTNQMPMTFVKCVKEVLKFKKNINIFLEMSSDLQQLCNDYINDKAKKEDFLKTFFYKNFYDGRQSKAFFKIIEVSKKFKDNIKLFCVDETKEDIDKDIVKEKEGKYNIYKSATFRDKVMFLNFSKYYDDNSINLIYAGSFHAMTKYPDNLEIRSMLAEKSFCMLIKERYPQIKSILLESKSGKAFNASFSSQGKKLLGVLKFGTDEMARENILKDKGIFIKLDNKEFDYKCNVGISTPSYKLKI